jgi:hypothetical protein
VTEENPIGREYRMAQREMVAEQGDDVGWHAVTHLLHLAREAAEAVEEVLGPFIAGASDDQLETALRVAIGTGVHADNSARLLGAEWERRGRAL